MGFAFEKKHREVCYEIIKTDKDYEILCNIAKVILETNKYIVLAKEISFFDKWINKEIITILGEEISFIEENYYLFFLALEYIEPFKNSFDNDIEFFKNLEKFEYDYNSQFLEMIMIILDNIFKLPVLDKLINGIATFNEDKYRYIFNIIAPTLSYLNVDNEKIILLLERINQIYPGKFVNEYNLFHSFYLFGIEEPLQAIILLDYIKNKSYTSELLTNLLIGLSYNHEYDFNVIHSKALDMINDLDFINFRAVIIACAMLNYEKHTTPKYETYNRFVELTKSTNNKIILDIVRGFNYFIKQEEKSIEWLIYFSKSQMKDVQEEVAWSLSVNNQKKNENWYKEVLLNLTSIREQNQNISSKLYNYIKSDIEFVFKFLDKWLFESKEYDKDISQIFPNIFFEVYKKDKKTLEKYITKWLNQDNEIVHIYVGNIFNNLKSYRVFLELDSEQIKILSDKDIKYILFKVMGYIEYNKELLCYIVFSLLLRKNQLIEDLICDIFINYISYNYPGYSSNFLKDKSLNGTCIEKRISKKILKEIRKSREAYNDLPILKELSISNVQVDYYNKMNNKYFNIIYKEQEKNSIISKLATKSYLKGGKNYFFKNNNQYSDKSTLVEIKAHEEMNQGEFIDPIGLRMQIISWRMYKRE